MTRRLHSFRIIFTLLAAGVLLDAGTTAIAVQCVGMGYEQSPIGISLLHHGSWAGITLLSLVALCIIYAGGSLWIRNRRRLSGLVRSLLATATFIRWVGFITTVLWLKGA